MSERIKRDKTYLATWFVLKNNLKNWEVLSMYILVAYNKCRPTTDLENTTNK